MGTGGITTSCNILLLLLFVQGLSAEVSLPKIFGDHMVLQRSKPIILWGYADPGETISIDFDQQKRETRTDESGKWKVTFHPMTAGGPFEMHISGKNQLILSDVLIGDVWLASGQSNMEWRILQTPYIERDSVWLNANKLRLFNVQIDVDYLPCENLKGGTWLSLTKENIAHFSAVAYHFSKHLCQQVDVPIGIINSSLGATSIETWMSNETLNSFEQFKPEMEPILALNKSVAQVKAEFQKCKT